MKKTLIIDIKDTFALETKSAIELLNSRNYTEDSFNNMTLSDLDDDGDVWLYYDTLGKKQIEETISTLENFHINTSMPIGSWVDLKLIMKTMDVKFYYDNKEDDEYMEVARWLYKNLGVRLRRYTKLDYIKADYVYSANYEFLQACSSPNKILKLMPYNNDKLDFNRVAIWSHFLRFLKEEDLGLKFSEVKLNETKE